MSNLRIMSNNIWWSDANSEIWAKNGDDCSAPTRAKGFFRVYKELAPDILGLQECSGFMGKILRRMFEDENLPYEFLYGRDTPILFRKDKFDVIETSSFIYREEVPGFEGSFNNCQTKSYCIVALKEKESDKVICFATTHLWWMEDDPKHKNYRAHSSEARAYQLNLLLDKAEEFIAKYNCPCIVVGDLNADISSIALTSAFNRGWLHTHDLASEKDETMGMHYCYADGFTTTPYDKDFSDSIDHILIKNQGDMVINSFNRYSPDYYMPLSDHFPVYIDVEF